MAALQPSHVPPSTFEYGGDEISALVLDPGTSWTRAGFAGEDTPKAVIPTDYGVTPDGKLHFGDNDVHTVRPGMEIRNPMKDGVVEDWDVAPHIWKYAITNRLTSALNEHPLIMTEPAWNPPKNREKTLEIAFEDFDVPAFYLAKSGVCASFGLGKATALVIDVGASNISITPVHDGLILRKGVTRSPLAGDFISGQIRAQFATANIPITPHYQVISKTPVEANTPAKANLRTFPESQEPTESFRRFEQDRVILEFKECVAQVWSSHAGPYNEHLAAQQPGRPFELPDGYNTMFGPDRFRVVEGMWQSNMILPDPSMQLDPATVLTIPQLIQQSINAVDVELRPLLLSNVVVTGGSSLLFGFTDRINNELSALYPGPRVRLNAPGITVERKFAGWLGASILASLGTFHQLWISKREYEEHGAGIVEKRCK
ncbi:Actin/actin-like protein [Terfezia boudieri ATCC MYA-4762]|uniref:Actin/actin-like protein n=1 Tax=Terfezia boudieri ATCC MYA-4762 TaxID=1051890 RepID=A0A3N4M2A3_9PEZI|nr:Actin/actin-like protein [Terfezia boudieri ATCC MYA-4762]